MTIKLTDAAVYYGGLEHQRQAWEFLQSKLTSEVLDEFGKLYRKKESRPVYVTLSQLAHIWDCDESLIQPREIDELNSCLEEFEITTPLRISHFLAQTAHESGGGRWKKELSDGSYLEGRWDLGNKKTGDGPRFKGAGYIQLTGRENYQRFSDYLGDAKVMDGCNYVAEVYPFTSAGFWWKDNNMNELCDTHPTVKQVTLKVNGGYNGLDDRQKYFSRCLDVI